MKYASYMSMKSETHLLCVLQENPASNEGMLNVRKKLATIIPRIQSSDSTARGQNTVIWGDQLFFERCKLYILILNY